MGCVGYRRVPKLPMRIWRLFNNQRIFSLWETGPLRVLSIMYDENPMIKKHVISHVRSLCSSYCCWHAVVMNNNIWKWIHLHSSASFNAVVNVVLHLEKEVTECLPYLNKTRRFLCSRDEKFSFFKMSNNAAAWSTYKSILADVSPLLHEVW